MRVLNIKSVLGRFWLLKLLLFPIFLVIWPFYFSYLYYFYSRQLSKNAGQRQLFFLALDQYGVTVPLLCYVRCWSDVRSSASLVVFTPQIELVRKLAKNICPAVQLIAPPVLFSNFVQRAFNVFARNFVFVPLYHKLLRKYPEALYINETRNVSKSVYVKHLDEIYKNRPYDSPFWDAYVETRKVFDVRYNVAQDFFQLAKDFRGIFVDEALVQDLLSGLKVPGKYVVININVKDYSNKIQNIRRIAHFERYNVLIDYLIDKGYSVVLQGQREQPFFSPRKGFIDYAHSKFQSAENDLLLFGGCEFYVSSKTGAEWYGLVCDKPVLGLNYTELSSMQPCSRLRFYPKRVRNKEGSYLLWREFLKHPLYFQLGQSLPTQETFEFVEMEEHEIIAAVEEFLQLLQKPREQWMNYSSLQADFKKMLHPGHLDLYHISGLPCEAYLKEDS